MYSFTALVALLAAAVVSVQAHPGHGMPAPRAAFSELVIRDDGNSTNPNSTAIATDNVPVFVPSACNCTPKTCDPRLNAASLCECNAQAQLACNLANSACDAPAENACS